MILPLFHIICTLIMTVIYENLVFSVKCVFCFAFWKSFCQKQNKTKTLKLQNSWSIFFQLVVDLLGCWCVTSVKRKELTWLHTYEQIIHNPLHEAAVIADKVGSHRSNHLSVCFWKEYTKVRMHLFNLPYYMPINKLRSWIRHNLINLVLPLLSVKRMTFSQMHRKEDVNSWGKCTTAQVVKRPSLLLVKKQGEIILTVHTLQFHEDC